MPQPAMNRDPQRHPFNVQCPVCEQARGFACRTRKTGRITDTHLPRFDRAYGTRDPEVLAAIPTVNTNLPASTTRKA